MPDRGCSMLINTRTAVTVTGSGFKKLLRMAGECTHTSNTDLAQGYCVPIDL